MSEIVKRLEDRAKGDGLGTYATKPYTVFDSNLDRAAAAEITRLEAEVSRLTNLAQEGRKAGLEEAAKNFDDGAALLEEMRGVYPGDPDGQMGRDAEESRAIAAEIRALIPQEQGK